MVPTFLRIEILQEHWGSPRLGLQQASRVRPWQVLPLLAARLVGQPQHFLPAMFENVKALDTSLCEFPGILGVHW